MQKGTKSKHSLHICKFCAGSGEVMYNSRDEGAHFEQCPTCQGTGRVLLFVTITYKPALPEELLRFRKIF